MNAPCFFCGFWPDGVIAHYYRQRQNRRVFLACRDRLVTLKSLARE